MKRLLPFWVVLILLTLSDAAYANPQGPGTAGGMVAGLLHPLLGVDHLLAMLTVGLLAAQRGGRVGWALPVAFVGAMVLGGIVGVSTRSFMVVEVGIAASVVILGAALTLGPRLPLPVVLALIGLFGLLHGHAHGTEMPAIAAPVLYALGFVVATTGLHILGVVAGRVALRTRQGAVGLRLSGAAIALSGIGLIVSLS